MRIGPDVLRIDPENVVREVEQSLVRAVVSVLRRKGLVVGISGGVDSAVVAALAVRALGPERVTALLMPERDSSPASRELGAKLAKQLGIEAIVEDIGPALSAIGCYQRQDDAIRSVFPEWKSEPGWTFKLTLPSVLESDRVSVSQLTMRTPQGVEKTSRMLPAAYRQLVAATNFKQRLRKTLEYYHADRLGYAVAGTPNRLEYDQGFFVKQGDGMADVKPIAHLYKSQVYALAAHLDVPAEIRDRPPTTDTFSMEQTQEEFFFAAGWATMDLCLWAKDKGVAPSDVASALDLTSAQVERVFRDIDAKRRAARYLHAPPILMEALGHLSVEAGDS